ncbi:MAG: hypothetical protein HC883_00155 [Bdellovibrionaceae bacterium]|nr:hypothetical protein [Pseudobdellovibrionaceae bacterium]
MMVEDKRIDVILDLTKENRADLAVLKNEMAELRGQRRAAGGFLNWLNTIGLLILSAFVGTK